jgi:serine/threonine-protein kinase PDIK1L
VVEYSLLGTCAVAVVLVLVGVRRWSARRRMEAIEMPLLGPDGAAVNSSQHFTSHNEPQLQNATVSDATYTIGRVIGRGGYGAIFEARCNESGREVAIKYIPMESEVDDRATLDEIHAIMRLQGHENIIEIIATTFSTEHQKPDSEDPDRVRRAKLKLSGEHILKQENCALIVTPLYKRGDLRKFVNRFAAHGRQFPEEIAVTLTKQLCLAIAFAHQRGVVHRDIKPENMLLTDDVRMVLTDFGLSKVVARTDQTLHTKAGSLPYVAPECFQGHYSKKVDNWSIGCVMYAVATMRVDADNARQLFADVKSSRFEATIREDLAHYSVEYSEVALGLLKAKAPDRLEVAEAASRLAVLEEQLKSAPSHT